MELVKFVAWAWLFCLIILSIGLIFGVIIEKYIDESNPIKKWWRKHIAAPDPYDNNWKNFNG